MLQQKLFSSCVSPLLVSSLHNNGNIAGLVLYAYPPAAGQDKTDVFGSIILHIVRVSAYIPVAAAYALLSAPFCVSEFL